MLGDTFGQTRVLPEGMEWNVHYSAVCLHARNLVDFLSNKGTFKAVDYAKKISTAKQGR